MKRFPSYSGDEKNKKRVWGYVPAVYMECFFVWRVVSHHSTLISLSLVLNDGKWIWSWKNETESEGTTGRNLGWWPVFVPKSFGAKLALKPATFISQSSMALIFFNYMWTSHIAKIFSSSVSVLLVVLLHVFLPSTQMGEVPSNDSEGITEFSPRQAGAFQPFSWQTFGKPLLVKP